MDINPHNFPQETALERDIARLSQEVKDMKNRPEHKEASPREIIKESLKIFTPAQSAAPVNAAPSDDSLLPKYMAQAPIDMKLAVEKLIDYALHAGFEEAVKEASKYGSFIIDAFHDALAEKVYPELKKRGILE